MLRLRNLRVEQSVDLSIVEQMVSEAEDTTRGYRRCWRDGGRANLTEVRNTDILA